jgi:plasmid stabilization system protein ParE
MRVIWTRAAVRDVQSAHDYLVDFNPTAAMRVAEALYRAGDGLAHFPRRGRPVAGTDMRELVASYPFIIRYRVNGDEVVILRVRHSTRRPTEC